MGRNKQKKEASPRFGHLPPQHDFFLNPHPDARFTRCPQCDAKTKLRKKLLFILIAPAQPLCLNKTCRYCPDCDLLIAHQDELDNLILKVCQAHSSLAAGSDYLVVGTVDRKHWKAGDRPVESIADIFAAVHDFKRYLSFEPPRYVWVFEGDES